MPTCPAAGASAPRGPAAAGGENRKAYPVAPAVVYWRGGLYRTASRRGPSAPDHAPAGCGVRYTPLSTHFLSRSSQCDTVYIRLRLTRRLYSRFIKRMHVEPGASASFPPPSCAVSSLAALERRRAAARRAPAGRCGGSVRAISGSPCGASPQSRSLVSLLGQRLVSLSQDCARLQQDHSGHVGTRCAQQHGRP